MTTQHSKWSTIKDWFVVAERLYPEHALDTIMSSLEPKQKNKHSKLYLGDMASFRIPSNLATRDWISKNPIKLTSGLESIIQPSECHAPPPRRPRMLHPFLSPMERCYVCLVFCDMWRHREGRKRPLHYLNFVWCQSCGIKPAYLRPQRKEWWFIILMLLDVREIVPTPKSQTQHHDSVPLSLRQLRKESQFGDCPNQM